MKFAIIGCNSEDAITFPHHTEVVTTPYGNARVIHATLPEDMPKAYLQVFQRLSRCAEQIACPEKTAELAQRAFYFFVLAQKGAYRRISPTQEDAFVAAFVCMAIHFQEQKITEEALGEAYDITVRRLNNALKIILTTLEEGSRE